MPREKLGRNLRERDLYLAYFVILILLSCFYDGETSTQTHRAFVPVSELYGRVKNHMAEIRDMVEDDAIAASHTFDLDFCSMAEVWYERSDDLETLVHPEKSNSRLGFVLKVMMFLQDEGLVHVLDREEVRLTEKCRQIVFRYYFNAQRKEALMRLLHQPNGKEPSEHAGS
uniref:DUF6063 family protein n=1 Tax=Alicyclobacillus tolerans TaxID=90970 RepID=UPI0023516A01|nr:DUF6063 family protein [Alicyclobacillus tolerans]